MMTARTAGTIVGLEDRIAYIDEQLTIGMLHAVEFPQREALVGAASRAHERFGKCALRRGATHRFLDDD